MVFGVTALLRGKENKKRTRDSNRANDEQIAPFTACPMELPDLQNNRHSLSTERGGEQWEPGAPRVGDAT